ncbi:Concanavalin A-like lectin/glucanase, subgroup [Artemisia annua]|uniref:Concanavalin A-like lectin/glucanase, subgroup n=1 Tax=Artemisia annua TaxID=35608 RepID=A0A2U1PGV2_ARTAN|nr:Concanavalin A-like lectin/glucanase, subgroup [Artemisia annua]
MNVKLSFVFSFSFQKTQDSSEGLLLNAIEISKYVPISSKTDKRDMNVLGEFRSMLASKDLIEEGDPSVPAEWEWVTCSLNSPPRITKMWLKGNSLNGTIPEGRWDI